MDKRLYWLWLANALGPADHHLPALLERYGTAEGIWEARMEIAREKLVSKRQLNPLSTTRPEDFADRLARHEDAGVQVIVYDDAAYPELLRRIDSPPAVLYLVGDASCLKAPVTIGMVGTRRPSAYGVDAAAKLADGIAAAGAVLVSGLADGLDSEAHKAAVRAHVPTIAVLGTAIDVCFPARNEKLRADIERCGAVISEYPIGTPGYSSYFLARNRIIAGLSRALCVVEARQHSGTMSTVRFALEYGREVFAVPGSIFSPLSEGTNALLAEGARLLTKPEDVLCDYLHLLQQPAEEPVKLAADLPEDWPLSGQAQQILPLLSTTPKGIEELCAESALGTGAVMAALTELEFAGLCRPLPGRRYTCFEA